jgi:hypothetical protein
MPARGARAVRKASGSIPGGKSRRSPNPESKTSRRKLVALEKGVAALALRRAGLGFREIGEQLGVPTSTAYDAVMGALRDAIEHRREAAEEVRQLEIERLDALLAAIWPKAGDGRLPQLDRVIRIMERRARLLGLDAPTRQEWAGPDGGPIPVEVTSAAEAREALRKAGVDS